MSETTRYRYPLKLPALLKETIMRLAKDDGVSFNQWITVAVAQKVGAVEGASEFLGRRATMAKPGALKRRLNDARRPTRAGRRVASGLITLCDLTVTDPALPDRAPSDNSTPL